MSECLHGYYVQNGELKCSDSFDSEKVYSKINVYEVIRVIGGVPLFYERHLNRLKKSMKLAKKEFPYTEEQFVIYMKMLIEANENIDGNIKIIINADRETDDFTLYYISHNYPKQKEYKEGVKTILYHGERENPNAKIVNNNFRENVNKKIKEENAFEAILVDNNGYITEGSRSNIFMVRGSKVITSPMADVLPGITREVIIEICKASNIDIVEEKVRFDEIEELDGAFISGTSPKILPINSIDSIICNSANNIIIKELMNKYDEIVSNYIKSWKNNLGD